MNSRPLSIVALGALAMLVAPSPASAGSPCCCSMPCVVPAPVVRVYRPYEPPPIYIVNQGPVFSGPGIYTAPEVVVPRRMPNYPYVAYDYPYDRGPYVRPLPRRGYRHPLSVRY